MRPQHFSSEKVTEAPDEPGVYLLIGTRGVVNYVGKTPTSIRARLHDHLAVGNVPVTTFRYEVIHEAEPRDQRERELVAEHTPDYNVGWTDQSAPSPTPPLPEPHKDAAKQAVDGDPETMMLWDRVREALEASPQLDIERLYDVFLVGRYVGELLERGDFRAFGPGAGQHEMSGAFRERPWACPRCEGDDVMVRDVVVPGGPPGDVRREALVVYEAKCMGCSAAWQCQFKPDKLVMTQTGTLDS